MARELLSRALVHRRTTLRAVGLAAAGLVVVMSTAVADEPASPAPVSVPAPAPARDLTDEELMALASQMETIEIWDERPDKPYDRDTEARLTGEELAARGATDLASALSLLPDVNVRDAGRGGFIIDIRGARKGAVRVLVDGVSVSDPYYGTFDVSTIPITDIVEIRVSTSAQSPLDGPGGPGGVIEVHTRDAVGPRLVVTRLASDTLPTFGASASGRVELRPHLAVRLSTSALWGLREYELPSADTLDERRRATTGAMRLEYRRGARRIAADGFVDDRRYVPPPNEQSATATILLVDRETTARAQLAADEKRGTLQLNARAWTHAMARRSRYFRDAALTDVATTEELSALRVGGTTLATRPIIKQARWVGSLTVDHERARVESTVGATTMPSRGDTTLIEAAAGAQYEDGPVRVDGAAGVAVPLGIGADPWPEAKLTARWRPVQAVELSTTVARKGRTPSLRERFDSVSGNPDLAPELASLAEVRASVEPREGTTLEVSPYWRRSTGSIVGGADNHLVNLGTTDVRGVDASARVRVLDPVEVGASYQLTAARARNADTDPWRDDPLDFLPRHRGDAWLRITPIRRVVVMGRVRHAGESIDRMNTVSASTLVDASASAELGGDWLGVLRLDDMLDERPEVRSNVRGPGRVLSLVIQGTWN
jgi:hypothetical protein